MRDPQGSERELEALGLELRRLPTPMPPEALVLRVRRLARVALAERAEERRNGLVLASLLLFSWAFGFFVVFALQLLGSGVGRASWWLLAYLVSAWISDAVVLVLLAVHVRKARRLA